MNPRLPGHVSTLSPADGTRGMAPRMALQVRVFPGGCPATPVMGLAGIAAMLKPTQRAVELFVRR